SWLTRPARPIKELADFHRCRCQTNALFRPRLVAIAESPFQISPSQCHSSVEIVTWGIPKSGPCLFRDDQSFGAVQCQSLGIRQENLARAAFGRIKIILRYSQSQPARHRV